MRHAGGIAGPQPRAPRVVARRLPGRNGGGHGKPLLFVWPAIGRVCVAGHHRRAGRCRARRRYRDDVAGTDVGLQHPALTGDHRELHRYGLHRRTRGEAVGHLARGPGSARVRQSTEGGGRNPAWGVQGTDRPHPHAALLVEGCREVGDGYRVRHRRMPARGNDAGRTLQITSGVLADRHRHGR